MKETTNLYEKRFKKVLKKKAEEDDNSYAGGALGAVAGGNTQGDFYASGDFRMPKALGAIYSRKGIVGKRRRKKKKKK